VGLIVLAGLVGDDWFRPLPVKTGRSEPTLLGSLLFRTLLGLDGLILVALGIWRPWPRKLDPASRISGPVVSITDQRDLSRRASTALLVIVTLVGAALRIFKLDSELWLDEIIHRLRFGGASFLEVMITYSSSNNHLLNTWLTNLAVSSLGNHEWVIRLPAVVFGVATIPALYLLARRAMPRWPSLASTVLVAVSYHHIFFSQNSRGYSAQLLFSILSIYFLIRGLNSDDERDWLGFIFATCANLVSVLTSVFVLMAQVLIGFGVLVRVKSQGGSARHTAIRLGTVFAIALMAALHFYVAAVPQMWIIMNTVYKRSDSGYRLISTEFSDELIRGLASGFGPGIAIAAVPLLAMAGLGLSGLWKRNWILTSATILPSILISIFLVIQDLTITPRFFLPLLIPTALACSRAIEWVGNWWDRKEKQHRKGSLAAAALTVGVIASLSLFSLHKYYQTPKQPYRTSIDYLEETRRSNQMVIALHNVRSGYEFYAHRKGLWSGGDYFSAKTIEELIETCRHQPRRPAILVTTFPRALRLTQPTLKAAIESGWQQSHRFPATVGDADITLWEQRRKDLSCLGVLEEKGFSPSRSQ
jgi:uncharacterized membrane protein